VTRNARISILLAVSAAAIFGTMLLPRVPQSPAYHNFADQRALLGIPNCLNVISNLPFLFVGIAGCLLIVQRTAGDRAVPRALPPVIATCYFVFFFGVLLTCFGSAYYHLAPDNARLVWDRLPMSVAFMAFLAAIIAERVSENAAAWLLAPLVACGIASLVYWNLTESLGRGDLRFYGLVQFYPVVAVGVMIAFFPARFTRTADLLGVVGFYVLAKLFEALDNPIFAAGHIVSGHTLKHLAAGASTYWLLRMLSLRRALPSSKTRNDFWVRPSTN
jgi:hypothetical protein